MDILSYLTTLIKTHKEVGIPGLGTIYKKKSPGRYDINTHSFLPPSYSLSFTSDLKEQSLLSELISKKKNISLDSSTYFIEQFSQNILDELSSHQESDFGDLGTFSTSSGSLTFIPKQDTNLGFDFYGLPQLKTEPDTDKVEIPEEKPIITETPEVTKDEEIIAAPQKVELPVNPESLLTETPQVTEEQLELENNNADLSDGTEKVDANDEQPVYEEISEVVHPIPTPNVPTPPVVETPEQIVESFGELQDVKPALNTDQPKENTVQPEEVQFTLDYTDAEKSGMPTYLKVISALAILAVLAGVLYLAKPDLFEGAVNKPAIKQQSVIPESTPIAQDIEQIRLDSIAHADSLRISNEKAILAADSARDSIAKVKPGTVIASGPEYTFEIIAASLRDQKEGDKFLADMKARGIPAKVANMPGRRVKISIGSFTDEEAAKKELEVLKKTTKIPGIYVIKVRHTNNPK